MASKPKDRPEDDAGFRWLELPGIYCDTYTIDLWKRPNVVRMVFGEYTDPEHSPFYRASIIMPVADVKSLIASLTALLEEEKKSETAKT